MSRTTNPNLYYRLVDLCAILTSVVLAIHACDYYIAISDQSWERTIGSRFSQLISSMGFSSFILTMVVILASRLRDEFAEAIWQKTAGTFLRAMVILPPVAMILITFSWSIAPEVPSLLDLDLSSAELAKEGLTVEDVNRFIGVIFTIGAYWWMSTTFFVFIYQWHRWRARS